MAASRVAISDRVVLGCGGLSEAVSSAIRANPDEQIRPPRIPCKSRSGLR
jgi:hypothetical protein